MQLDTYKLTHVCILRSQADGLHCLQSEASSSRGTSDGQVAQAETNRCCSPHSESASSSRQQGFEVCVLCTVNEHRSQNCSPATVICSTFRLRWTRARQLLLAEALQQQVPILQMLHVNQNRCDLQFRSSKPLRFVHAVSLHPNSHTQDMQYPACCYRHFGSYTGT